MNTSIKINHAIADTISDAVADNHKINITLQAIKDIQLGYNMTRLQTITELVNYQNWIISTNPHPNHEKAVIKTCQLASKIINKL